jgi:hypothetical protein
MVKDQYFADINDFQEHDLLRVKTSHGDIKTSGPRGSVSSC